jgi:replicative DNA helicase
VTGSVPPHNLEAETGVLGAALLTAPAAPAALAEGLRSEHFYRPRHQLIWTAMTALIDRAEAIDALTVTEELRRMGELEEAGGESFVHALPVEVPAVGNLMHYVRITMRYAGLREVLGAARDLQEAAMRMDEDGIAAAEARLVRPSAEGEGRTRDQRQEQIIDHFDRDHIKRWHWPFQKLDEMTGGLWPGHLTVLIGWSRHGKSVFADQILEKAARHGARCAAYLTEMTDLERDLRLVARRTGLPLMRLMHGNLDEEKGHEHRQLVNAIKELPFDIFPAGGKSAREVGRHIRRHAWDVAVVDLLNVVTGREVQDIDDDVAYLAGLAADTGTHIIGCQHLNRGRLGAQNPYPPEPAEGDIRGSGAIFDLSTNCLSVYLKERLVQDRAGDWVPSGKPGSEAFINFLKVKNGIDGRMEAVFNGSRMRFDLPLEERQGVAA